MKKIKTMVYFRHLLILLLFVCSGSSAISNISSKSFLPPVGVKAKVIDDCAVVDWKDPSMVSVFRNDDGKCTGGIGTNSGTYKTVLGVVHNVAAELYSMSWITSKNDVNYNTINIFVFDLDQSGKPTNKILFSAMGVPNIDGNWSSYTFDSVVYAPRGFLVGVSIDGNGNVGVGVDSGKNAEWPFVPNSNYIAGDYNTGFSCLDSQSLKNNIMIRAEGIEMSSVKNERCLLFERSTMVDVISPDIQLIPMPTKPILTKRGDDVDKSSITGYKVWRLKVGQESNEGSWELLTNSPIVQLDYTDSEWSTLSQGCYKYAVKALYGTEISPASISSMVAKDMICMVKVLVNTNITSFIPVGAAVRLTNKDGDSRHIYNGIVSSDGSVMFDKVWKGMYEANVELQGFISVYKDNIDISTDSSYELNDYKLIEIVENPYNLRVSKTYTPHQRLFEWNRTESINDDFEEHKDFAINSSGRIGWSYIDGDQSKTYGITNVEFENMGSKMAYIVFNPSQTKPLMSQIPDALPHSGLKYLASFAAMPTQAGVAPVPNDDFLISPELSFTDDFQIRFWAKSYLKEYSEKFRVGYSTTGKNKADFSNWITPTAVTAPNVWTQFSYVIPSNAKYVTIQYVSQDCFLFMLDDIFIGAKESGAIVQKYEIYLDGVKVAETNDSSYEFDNLTLGNHTVGVKSVFRSKTTDMQTLQINIDDKGFKVKGVVKDSDGGFVVNGEVIITGDNHYNTQTNDLGEFEFLAVFVGNKYTITVKKANLSTYSKEFDVVSSDVIMNDIVMTDIALKPGYVSVTANDAKVNISWLDPTQMISFRRDNGTPIGGVGSNAGNDKTVVGTMYKTSAILHNISWMTAKEGENTINIYVFELDPSGNYPSQKPLLIVNDVYNKGLTWNTYVFEEPLSCPGGFFIGISGTVQGNVALAVDSGTDPQYPFISNVNYLTLDYTQVMGAFQSIDKSFPFNLMIRAEGLALYDDKSVVDLSKSHKSLKGYKVWRLKVGQENKPNEWVSITDNVILSTNCDDMAWEHLTPAKYRYAVKSVYSEDIISEASLSNPIAKEAITSVTVNVKTNAAGISAVGAVVTLKDKSLTQTYSATVEEDGKAIFDKVQKGIYGITIRLDGFAILDIADMDFSTANNYNIGPFTLKEMLATPANLQIIKENTDFERLFTWTWSEDRNDSYADFYCRGFATYEIYLDDNKIGETAEMLYRISGLQYGDHKAGVRIRNSQGVSEIASVDFHVEEGVGVSNIDSKMFKLYPNPVADKHFTIEGIDIQMIKIYNGSGELVKESRFGNPLNKVLVQTNDFRSGVYLIQVYSKDSVETCKLIIR